MAFGKLASFFGLDDNENNVSEDVMPPDISMEVDNQKDNVVALSTHTAQKPSKIQVVEPHSYADAKQIAKELLISRAVIVNYRNVTDEQMRRIADFLSGAIYATKGDISQVDEQVFLYAPLNFKVNSNAINFND
ncbi:cell division protein SepF [Bombilactobacillus folatiphilus]|uniref:Cell division protein SepF n=1 Tax=Bombilactobacillus folatiphilus TaxID=2923362 RepID=A0ABY4PAC2_9LACO|nr:cell division protein SepF [Bombilactobacillus folatiphilus]UQS82708.1 cell division protein SepF [Bombilactobacillus folatiphilus]